MKRISYIFLVTLAVVAGCTKGFLDINTDPNNPSKVALKQLLPASEQGLAYAMGFTNDARGARGLTEVLSVYMHQIVVREDADQYGATGTQFDINGAWNDYYSAQIAGTGSDYIGMMENVEVMIKQATTGNNHIYAGIGKLLKAYGYSQFVDAFADIPYSEANKFGPDGLRYPKFDKGSDIYPQLFKLIDEAIADLQNPDGNLIAPAGDDVFYGGSTAAWIRMAKSLKLKLYNQLRLVQDVSGPINQLITAGGLISSTGQGFMLKYGSQASPDDRNPGFSEYYATQKSHYISPWFYEIMKGYNPRLFTGIRDPRLPYYFYKQNSATGGSQSTTEFRDSGFVSIYFGSTGPNRNWSQDNSMTVFGMYPVGGRYDQGDAKPVSGSSGTGAAPIRLISYSDILYIQAELMNAGIIAGDARQKLSDAIDESFKQVDFITALAKGAQTVPLIVGASSTEYKNKILAIYDSKGTAAEKLEIIMTQKWIQSFGFSGDQYSDYRRTGYPILFDPNNPAMAPGGQVQPPVFGNPTIPPPQPKVRVTLGKRYPLSLPWPSSELNVNPNAPAQKLPDAVPVFWDK